MNLKIAALGLGLVVVSGVSVAGDRYYGPPVYSNSYGGYWHSYPNPQVAYYKKVYEGPYWDARTRSNYYVEKQVPVYSEAKPSGYVPNPGRYYVEKYAPHAAHHVPQFVPAEKSTITYKHGEVVTQKTEVKEAPKTVEETKPFVPEPGKKYYIEDGVYKEVVPGTKTFKSSDDEEVYESSGEAYGRSIGEYYRRRYGR